MAAYLIQDTTMTAIANQVRRLTGTNAPLSPAQMAAALAAFSPGSGDEDFDSFRFHNMIADIENCGPWDEHGNEITPLEALELLERYMVGPASTVYSVSILSKFNPADIQSGKQVETLAEIKMPACTSISREAFKRHHNLVAASFPACMSVGESAFYECELLESLTLNSACNISDYCFDGVVIPDSGKIFKLYLRGGAMGSAPDHLMIYSGAGCSWGDAQDLYSGTIPGLEIYVPASLLNNFKTTWAGGVFADNIYPLTD